MNVKTMEPNTNRIDVELLDVRHNVCTGGQAKQSDKGTNTICRMGRRTVGAGLPRFDHVAGGGARSHVDRHVYIIAC